MEDVLVVGGGIVGSFIALECRARGMTVALVDAGPTRPSASWAGGGILSPLFPWRAHAAWRPLVVDARARYGRWQAQIAEESGLQPEINDCGMLVREPQPAQATVWSTLARERVLAASQSGLAATFADRADLWMPDIAAVRNSRWLDALSGLCQVRGIRQIAGVVSSIEESAGRVCVRVGTSSFLAGQVVVAAGHWSRKLLGDLGGMDTTMPVKGEMLLYRLEPGEIPAILLADAGYLIPRCDGLVLAGSTLQPGVDDILPGEAALGELAVMAASWYPPLATCQPIAQWAGIRPGTRRALPLIGPLSKGKRIHVASGHFRNGLVSAPATGELVAQMLADERPFCDPAPYSPS